MDIKPTDCENIEIIKPTKEQMAIIKEIMAQNRKILEINDVIAKGIILPPMILRPRKDK